MALIHWDSCSDCAAGNFNVIGGTLISGWNNVGPGNQVTGRDGTTVGAIGTPQNSSSRLQFANSASEFVIGAALFHSAPTGTGNGYMFMGDAGSTQMLSMTFDVSSHIVMRLGGSGGTVLATSSYVFPTSEWHYVEFKVKLDDTTGYLVVRVDEAEVINVTAQDTKVGATTTIDGFMGYRNNASGVDTRIDDLYFLDLTGSAPYNDYLGDVNVKRLYPSGNGNSSDLVGSDSNSTDNYLLVDETVASASDYVDSATATNKDLYAMGDLTYSSGTVLGVMPIVTAAKTDAGTRGLKITDRQTGNRSQSTQTVAVTYANYMVPLTTDADGNQWTLARVNSMQVGVEVV